MCQPERCRGLSGARQAVHPCAADRHWHAAYRPWTTGTTYMELTQVR